MQRSIFSVLVSGLLFGTLALSDNASAATCAAALNAPPCTLGTEMVEFQETRTGGRYFSTACTNEIAAVTALVSTSTSTPSFRKTGETVPVFGNTVAGVAGLNRYQLYIADGTVSHFYTALAPEQQLVKSLFLDVNPPKGCTDSANTGNWKLPAPLVNNGIDKSTSACPAGSAPIWRMLRTSAVDPTLANHRFTAKYQLVQSELRNDATWTLDGLTGCAKDPYAVTYHSWGVATSSANNGQNPLAAGATITLRSVYSTLDRQVVSGQTTLRLSLPLGVEFVVPSPSNIPSQPNCATSDSASGRELRCVLPSLNASSAAEAFVTLRTTSAYAAPSVAARTIKSSVVIADATQDVAIPQSPDSCEANGVPHVGCGIFVLPAAATVATQTTMAVEIPLSSVNAYVGTSTTATFDCVNTGTIAALAATCGLTPTLAAPLSVTCSPSASVVSLAVGARIRCTVAGTPVAANIGVTSYEVAANASNAVAKQTSNIAFVVSQLSATPTLSVSAPVAQTVTFGSAIAPMSFICSNISTVTATNATCSIAGASDIGLSTTCTPVPPQSLPAGSSVSCIVAGVPTASGTLTASTSATGAISQTATARITVSPVSGGSIGVALGTLNVGTATTNRDGNTTIPLSATTNVVAITVPIYVFPQYLSTSGSWTSPAESGYPTQQQISVGNGTLSADLILPLGTQSPVSVRLCASSQPAFNLAYEACRQPNVTTDAKQATFNATAIVGTLTVSAPSLPSVSQGSAYPISTFQYGISSSVGTVSGLSCSAQGFPSGISVSGCSASPSSLSGSQSATCTCSVSGSATSGASSSTVTLSASAASGANPGVSYASVVVNAVQQVTLDLTRVSISTPTVAEASPVAADKSVVTATITGNGTSGKAAIYFEVANGEGPWVGTSYDINPITVSSSGTVINQTVSVPTGAGVSSIKYRVCVGAAGGFYQPSYNQTTCSGAIATSAASAISSVYTKTIGPPPAVVTVAWKTGTGETPSSLQVGDSATWTVAVSSKVAAQPFAGPLFLSVALPDNSELVSATLSDTGVVATQCSPVSGSTVIVQCTVQSGASASLTGEVAYRLTVRVKPGAGGKTFALTALAATSLTTGVTCASNTTTGDGCAISPTLTPTYYDLRVQTTDVLPANLDAGNLPLTLTCGTDASAAASAPLPSPLLAQCATTVTYDDDTVAAATPQPYVGTATPIANVKLCASGSSATDCALTLKAAPRTVKSIAMNVANPPASDNDSTNNARIVYAAAITDCVDQSTAYSRTFNGATSITSPNYDVTMSPGQVLSIEIIDGAGISKFPADPNAAISMFWGSRDLQGARDFSISKCRGDFSATALTFVPYTQANSPIGSAYFFVLSAQETATPTLRDERYFSVRQNARGRWFINVRHRSCNVVGGSSADNTCTIFYSMTSR